MEFLVNMSNCEKRRKERKKRELEAEKPKWYYDSCTLEKELFLREMANRYPKKPIISHLALGEAYGNCLYKDGEEKVKLFLEFIAWMQESKCLNIVENNGIENIFDEIKAIPKYRFGITDTMHLATAIKNDCCVFKTSDERDFKDLDKSSIYDIAKKYGVSDFSISTIKLKK